MEKKRKIKKNKNKEKSSGLFSKMKSQRDFAVYKYIQRVNIREEEEPFKLKDNVGTEQMCASWP